MPERLRIDGYEVKFPLDASRVLAADGGPTPAVAAALHIAGGPDEYRVAFLDGPHLDFHTERWNVRFRDKGGGREVSFKRRLPVYHGSVEGVVGTAFRQGFDAGEQAEGYTAEIEWGPQRRTLSLVKEKELGGTPWPLTDAAACAVAADAMPGKLSAWLRAGWTESVLKVARVYGPVRARKWSWVWAAAGGKTAFEVWDVRTADGGGTEPMVEVSFKTKTEEKAAAARGAVAAILDAEGWTLADAPLKTDRVLERYR